MTLEKTFSNLKIILVEPNGPLNVGSVARLCSNFEVDELRIVSPKCDIFSLEAKKMALKGYKFIEECQIFKTIEQATFDCDLVLATSGRIQTRTDSSFEAVEDVSRWISSLSKIKNLAVVFGREDRGLTNRELLFAQKIIYIPSSPDFSSLNLSHAVSIILYEINKSLGVDLNENLEVFNLASSKQINDSFLEIEDLLNKVGYLLNHTSFAKISKFKKYVLRANTSIHEMNVLRGIVRQINWFLNNSKNN